jgi:SAM-dependent methyltransferase
MQTEIGNIQIKDVNNKEIKKSPLIYLAALDINRWDYLNARIQDFDYHKIVTDFHQWVNMVGDQQRAFVVYWAIKEHERTGGIGLEPGCGQVISPYCIGTDYYAGPMHPQYGGDYWPHIRCLGEMIPFKNETFDFLVSHHSLEHMKDAIATLKEWLRVLKHGSKMAIVVPDKKHGPFDDFNHPSEYEAEEFRDILNQISGIKIIEYDTLKNNFSYNMVIEKI